MNWFLVTDWMKLMHLKDNLSKLSLLFLIFGKKLIKTAKIVKIVEKSVQIQIQISLLL